MTITKPPSARLLGASSLVLWCASLALPGLTLYSDKVLFGLEILLTGWLSPLMVNFAWFANVFYIFGVIKLLAGGVPWASIVWAALLSLDTIRFAQYMLNEGGATTPVYGYGWGAVLWFVAIFMLLAAADLRRHEVSKGEGSPEQIWEPKRQIGLLLAAGTLIGAGILAIHDHLVANAYEARRLTPLVAFKRTAVCTAPDPVVKEPLRNFSGILEVVSPDTNSSSMSRYPFDQIQYLLEWGIPVVRVSGSDFYLTTGPKPKLMSKPATGQPSAVLTHGGKSDIGITARLVDAATERVIFDQKWKREDHNDKNSYIYCPDYRSNPSQDDQPRKLIMQALGFSDGKPAKQSAVEHEIFSRVAGVAIERKDGGKTRKMIVAERYPGLSTFEAFRAHRDEITNTNCPSDIGWDMRDNNISWHIGRPFKMAGVAHYLRPRDSTYAFCDAGAAYIYQGTDSHGTYYLNIEKRSIPDFRQLWAGIVVIPIDTRRNDVLNVHAIESSSGGVTLELVNDDTGEILLVKAPLVDSLGQ